MSAEALPLLRKSLDESESSILHPPQETGGEYFEDAELEDTRASRVALERKLVRKLDVRMSILVIIYILNYVRIPPLSLILECLSRFYSLSQQTDRS